MFLPLTLLFKFISSYSPKHWGRRCNSCDDALACPHLGGKTLAKPENTPKQVPTMRLCISTSRRLVKSPVTHNFDPATHLYNRTCFVKICQELTKEMWFAQRDAFSCHFGLVAHSSAKEARCWPPDKPLQPSFKTFLMKLSNQVFEEIS